MKNLYEDIANKSAAAIGFDRTDIETFARSKQELFENNLNGAEPLKNYLSYRYFDKSTENFLLSDSSGGFLLEICPLVGVNDSIVKNLNQFFAKELPSGGCLQFLLIASSDIEDFLANWGEGRINSDPILQRITSSRQEYLRKAAANFHNSGKKLPRTFKIFVSYSKKYRNCNEAALSDLKNFRKSLMNKLSSLNLQPRVGDTDSLVRICRDMLEFEPEVKPHYNPTSKLDFVNNQCLSVGHYYQTKKDSFVNTKTGIAHRAFAIKGMPDFWSLLQNINLLGGAEGAPLPARFIISYTISNDHSTKKTFIARGKRVIDAAERPYARHDKALHAEASEWREIIRRLNVEDNILSDSWTLTLSSKEEHIDAVCSDVMTQYSAEEWELTRLDYFHLEAMIGSMPMHGANLWQELKQKKLVQPVLSSEVVSRLPIHAEWYGVPISGVPLIGRRGQVFNWNPYYRIAAGGFNVNVSGPTGVGKSVFLQCLADSMLSSNTRVFILDIGGSYASLAKLLGGEIIEFGALSTFTINPFSGLKKEMTEEEFNKIVVCAKELLAIMCGAIGEFESASLEKAIKDAVKENNYQLDLHRFVKFLKASSSELLNKFGGTLYSYTPDGVFGKYFSGEKSANFDKPITIFEFEHVKTQPKLIAIILQTLLMQITSQFLTGDRSQKFMIIVDEAWMLLDHCAGFLAALARNLRRYGGSLVVCTQCFADLQTAGKSQDNNTHRRAIFENSSWKVTLPPSSFSDFEGHAEFEEKVPLLKSLSFAPGQYSEMLFSSSGIDVVGRLLLDPFSSALFSTESEDFGFIQQQEARGIPMEQIMDNLIEAKANAKR
jgi:type-IV secretion system protein TraC